MLRFLVVLVLAAALGAEPISYHRHIAPILAMHCHTCHGANPDSAAAGLSTRTWADLRRGGKMGPVVLPGQPDQSPLLQFVNGARGEAHRMPLGAPPLAAEQIAHIRQWIAEGALLDQDTTTSYRLELPAVAIPTAQPVRFLCRLPVPGYVELELTDARNRRLHMDGAPDTAGQALHWDLRRASHWPPSVRVRLTVSHVGSEPVPVVFAAGTAAGAEIPAGRVAVRVHAWPAESLVFAGDETLPGGLSGLARWLRRFSPGLYLVHLRHPAGEVSALLRNR